ncbi:hypothetical protein BU26DRAFT_568902 [Trematosphaeria pertusa]|uniref:Uncharacterized protein n=1 Tax=Trematosphaeria pertusa TaxID=390896 RepID=A0A6A6I3L7_9PLEO|nr:uncharacterized protein BU26DRAFT_568902 [Trematosphaeria pertusa]KAF2244911.1 hypothetical protein BU26DRAFT_568902 [Trematosphaeria pertusa]
MKIFVAAAAFGALSSAATIPIVPIPPTPTPTIIEPPVKPMSKPLACTKICAAGPYSLSCGKDWFPFQQGRCWSCCRWWDRGDEDVAE